jgi:TDG/mug DNA glycosylase family protein
MQRTAGSDLNFRPQAAELSAHEMRLAVPSLLEKLKRYRPGLVCFVGKGIWDKFEDIVRKASEAPEMAWESIELNLPQDTQNDGEDEDTKPDPVKLEERPSLVSIDDAKTLPDAPDIKPESSPSDTGKKRKPKAAFDWTQPRSFKLVHPAEGDRAESDTLFWVVPSTSGLERTPVSWGFLLSLSTKPTDG